MAGTTRKLWCLIEGERNPFPVTASDVHIAELKNIIKEDAEINLAAHRLTLWKVRYF